MPDASTVDTTAKLVEVLDQYLAQVQAGKAPDKQKLVDAHPELADDLAACLDSLEFVHYAGIKPVARTSQPRVLGDYVLLREVGRGGMGVVYETEQRSLGRRVALKILPFASVLDNRQLSRFQNEAHAAAQLNHPNIVPVFSVGCEQGVHYYAMQFIDGSTVADVIAHLRGQLGRDELQPTVSQTGGLESSPPYLAPAADTDSIKPDTTVDPLDARACLPEIGSELSGAVAPRNQRRFRNVAEICRQIAEALDHAHEVGIIHRDVKPSNLILDKQTKVWITDFGLALSRSNAGVTMSGDLVGTVRYMSPEQATAKKGAVDHRTDIYSLGATCYEMLALRPAFAGEDQHELLRHVLAVDPLPLRRLNRKIPRDLETIVLTALAKNPESRYQTAQEMADDFQRFLDDHPIRARPPTVRQHLHKWARRHRALVYLALLVMVITGSFAAGSWAWISLDREARIQAAIRMAAREMDLAESVLRQGAVGDSKLATSRADATLVGLPRNVGGTVRDRIRQTKADLGLVEELEEIRLIKSTVTADHFDLALSDAAYEDLFRRSDIDFSNGSAELQLENSLIRDHLITALDDWALVRRLGKKKSPEWKALLQLSARVDPHSIAKQIREAICRQDLDSLQRLWDHPALDTCLPGVHLLVADALNRAGQGDNATSLLQRAQKKHPGDFWVNHSLGLQFEKAQNWTEAIRFYQTAVGVRPESPGARVNLGNALRNAGRQREAVQAYRAAIALKPDYAMAHNNVGAALENQGDFHGATSAYQTAIRFRPSLALAHHNLAFVHWRRGKLDDAVAEFRQTLVHQPDFYRAAYNLGLVLEKSERATEALAAYQHAIQLHPEYAQAHCNIGHLHFRAGRIADALKSFRRGHELGRQQPNWSYPSDRWVRECERLLGVR